MAQNKTTPQELLKNAHDYLTHGYHLIPVTPNTKRPAWAAWTTAEPLGDGTLPTWIKDGYNIGIRPREGDLIIDVDIRNRAEGELSLTRLTNDCPQLGQYPYITTSASGGWHYLLTYPDWIDHEDIPYTMKRYPGIQFLTKGQQALIGGSIVDGRAYQRNPQAVFPAPECPPALLELFLKERDGVSAQTLSDDRQAIAKGWGCINATDLQTILEVLPVEDYAADTPHMWFDLMCAAHFATAGDETALEFFIDWSESDPTYQGHGVFHRKRWKSLSDGVGKRPITAWHLNRELERAEVPLTWFRDVLEEAKAGDMFEKVDMVEVDHADNQRQMGTLDAAIDQLSGIHEVPKFMATYIKDDMDPVIVDAALNALKVRFGKLTSMATLRKQLKKQTETGYQGEIDQQTAKDKFVKHLGGTEQVIYSGGVIWIWNANRGIFEKCIKEALRGRIQNWLEQHKIKYTATFIKSVGDLVIQECALQEDYQWDLGPSGQGQMFNMKNGELWITPEGVELRQHDPKNKRRAVLDMEYDPHDLGLPETWLKYLGTAFRDKNLRTIERLLALGIAYSCVESRPFLKKSWFLYGPPNTGKSALMDLLNAMVGPGNWSSVDLGKLAGSRFATAQLLGKLINTQAELSRKDRTEPSTFKALVAGDPLDAEFKGENAFSLSNRAILWLGGNHLPRFTEGSSGVMERMCIIPFQSALLLSDRDEFLSDKLIAEKQEIFHWALGVYAKEYRKDRCKSALEELVDEDVVQAMSDETLPHMTWIRNHVIVTNDMEDFVPTEVIWDNYQSWQMGTEEGEIFHSCMAFGRALPEWLNEVPDSRIKKDRGSYDKKQSQGYRGLKIV